MSSDSQLTIHDSRPGRSCPLSYRYAPAALARAPDIVADTLYVVGGLYGNQSALECVLERASAETGRTAIVFNGDFNWFNVDAEAFQSVNRAVLEQVALRGNVETELAAENSEAGCGCGYPEWVSDAQVQHSNAIMERLRAVAVAFPEIQGRLRLLPMNLVARVGLARVAIVHGDAESLAGWGFAQETLDDPGQLIKISQWFDEAGVDIFASSHTCLPVACAFPRGRVLANNGAAGMPNFRGSRCGVITRVSAAQPPAAEAFYTLYAGDARIEALPVNYDSARFEREFLANWPEGSAAHASYYRRITQGPDYGAARALRLQPALTEGHRLQPSQQENRT